MKYLFATLFSLLLIGQLEAQLNGDPGAPYLKNNKIPPFSITSDLSFKAEYLYLSMSGINGASTGAVLTDQSVLMGNYTTGTISNSLMRVGANWKFGRSSEEPISAKP